MEIISNIGLNWWTNGDQGKRTKKIVSAAIDSGVHGICVPYFQVEKVHRVPNAIANFKRFNTPKDIILLTQKMADNAGIKFIVTPSHADQIDYLEEIGVEIFHIENGCHKYWPLLERLTGNNVLFSTGFATLPEIEQALNVLMYSDSEYEYNYSPDDMEKITLLHSTGALPTPSKEAQLTRILDLQSDFFPMNVGLESLFEHRLLDFVAMAFRPSIIMRKLDLGDNKGVEASYSLVPEELKILVKVSEIMDDVNNPEIYAEEFTEGDWEARTNRVRCKSVDYTLPPEN